MNQSLCRALLLALLLPYCPSATGKLPSAIPAQATGQQTEVSLSSRLFTPSMIGFLALVLWVTAPQDVQGRLIEQIAPSKLATNFLAEYSSCAFATLSHEAGHALVQSLATGRPSTIHLGSSTMTGKPPLFSIGNVHIDGLNPLHGHTPHNFITKEQKDELLKMISEAYQQPDQSVAATGTPDQIELIAQCPELLALKNSLLPDRKLYALFLLAGGLSGLITHHAAQKILTKSMHIDSITINQLMNALVPMDQNSDGAALWRDCVGVPPVIINAVIEIAPLLEIAGEILVAFHDPHSEPNAPQHCKLLIGFINYFSRGYLRFHV